MLGGLRVLGETALEWRRPHADSEEAALLQTLVKVDDLGRYAGIVHLDLRAEGGQWRLASPEMHEMDSEHLYQALWVGHASRNVAQDRVTVATLDYLISQALPALALGLENGALRAEIEQALAEAYLELPVQKSSDERYRWVWNLPTLGWADWEWVPKARRKELEVLGATQGTDVLTSSQLQAYAQDQGAKKAVALIAAILQEGIRQELNLDKKAKYLYTLHLNGRWLAREPAYHRYLYGNYLSDVFEKARPGRCHVCGKHQAEVTENTTRFWFKVYITDKPGFASGFRKVNFYRNYAICRQCYQTLLAGETFMRTRLKGRLGQLSSRVYIVPLFHRTTIRPPAADLEAWAGYVTDRWEATLTWNGWQAFQSKLKAYQRFENTKASYLLDFLFIQDDGRSTKLQEYIRDVPPSRLDEVDEARHLTRSFAQQHLAPIRTERWDPWDLGLNTIFYLFPIGKRGHGQQAFFQFLEALLSNRPVDFRELLPLFLETASVHRFHKYGAYVQAPQKDPDAALRVFLVQTHLLRYYLSKLHLFKGGRSMSDIKHANEVRNLIPEDVWSYMDALELGTAERALFLLGILVGAVASAQQATGSVPILNKIHFQGMDTNKVRRLSNEMLDQLRIYRALNPTTRDLFAASRTLMDQAKGLLSPAENTYWVLSGYAFSHLQRYGNPKKTAQADTTQITSQKEDES